MELLTEDTADPLRLHSPPSALVFRTSILHPAPDSRARPTSRRPRTLGRIGAHRPDDGMPDHPRLRLGQPV